MKKTKFKPCIKCSGRGYIGHYKSGDGWASSWSENCCDCNGQGYIEVPMTNADCIRKMNDEDIADFLLNYFAHGYEHHGYVNMDSKYKEIMKWLQKEVGDNG